MILDLFAGPGGWDVGLGMLGRSDVVGIEWDKAACDTRRAAGHKTIRADVATYPAEVFRGKAEGVIASPPCPDFSSAGRRRGINGTSGHLIFEVLRWTRAIRPIWLACEQVPEVLPYWQKFAYELAGDGYSSWSGILCAAALGDIYRIRIIAATGSPCSPQAGCSPQIKVRDGSIDEDGPVAVKLTIQEALILQGFAPDYPLQGSRTKQFEQVGNAVPPPLAAAVLGVLL